MAPSAADQPTSNIESPRADTTAGGGELTVPTLGELVRTTTHLGAIGYGGPAILALMKQTLVAKKHWISEKDFMNALSLAQALPGATGVTVLGYVGFKLKKVWGGVLAPLGFVTPPTVLMIGLSWAYFTYGQLPFVKALFAGLGALVVALLVNAFLVLGKAVFPKLGWRSWKGLLIALASFALAYFFHLNVIWIVLGAAVVGYLLFSLAAGDAPGAISETPAPAAPKPERLSIRDLIPALVVAAIVAAALLVPYTRELMATFLGIGATAFGGGFGSIPLIQASVVDAHGWLTTKEFVDGIALGQITPGPVFITATFIGYRVAGVIGAIVATLGVFLPSLTAIILMADLHGRIQGHKAVQAVIKGLQAAFIGLIASVALQFALKSLLTWQEWLIFVAGFVYIAILKKNSVWAILATIAFSFLFM